MPRFASDNLTLYAYLYAPALENKASTSYEFSEYIYGSLVSAG